MLTIFKKPSNGLFAFGVSQRYSNPIVKPKNVLMKPAVLVVDMKHSQGAKEARQLADALLRQPSISKYNVNSRPQASKTPPRFFKGVRI